MQTAAPTLEGIQRADAGADEYWKVRAYEAARTVVERRGVFTADDVWEELGETTTTATTPTAAAMGPIMLRLKREGLAQPTGLFLPASKRRTSRNGHQYIQVWAATHD